MDFPIESIANGADEYVFTTHVKHQEHFFVHVESRSKVLDDIMTNLAERYMDLGVQDKILHNLKLGALCAAKFTDDNNWYRAKITGLMANDLIEVQFVDYGNTDYVSTDRVRALDPDLTRYPMQSYRCALAEVSIAQGFWSPELMVQFEDLVVDKRCRAVFLGKREHDEVYLLEMYDERGNNLNCMFGAKNFKLSDGVRGEGVQNGYGDDTNFPVMSLEIGETFQATVVYVKSPGLFWCQDTAYLSNILIMSEALSRLYMTQDIKPLKTITPGMICAAKCSEDEVWYRGRVQSVTHKSANVYFIDFGNSELIDLDHICPLRQDMRKMPALGVKCCLANVDPKGREWSPHVKKFDDLVADKEFEVKIVKKDGDMYTVTLLDIVENQDVGSQLTAFINRNKSEDQLKGSGSKPNAFGDLPGIGPSLSVGSRAEVFLSWINDPGDFWIQAKDSEDLLKQLSQKLQDVYASPQPIAPSAPGAFVVARLTEDKMWYRCLVLKDLEDGRVQVLFIDFGNSHAVSKHELRQVMPEFGEVIPLACHCSLVGVKPLCKGDRSWTGDAKDFLEKLTANGCHCEIVGQTESHRLVKLVAGDKDVAKELMALKVVADAVREAKPTPLSFVQGNVMVRKYQKEAVVVTYVESPQKFWCQLCKNTLALNILMGRLSQHYSDDGGIPLKSLMVGQACIVKYSRDNGWYRATIVSISPSCLDVFFVDYGNTETVPAYLVCEPEPRFLDMPAQSMECSLPVTEDLSHLTDTFTSAVLEKEFQMEVLETPKRELTIVELYDGEKCMSEHLKNIKGMTSTSKRTGTDCQMSAKSIPVGSKVEVFTSVVVSPQKFFLQLAGVDEELGTLMDNIALKYVSDNPPATLNSPQPGQPCVALYPEDNHWYRGRILSVQGNKIRVLYVDYGNEESISLDDIKVITPDIASVPIMAYQCSLSGLEESLWSAETKAFFQGLVMDKELECTFVTSSSVAMTSDGQDILEQFVSAGHGRAVKFSQKVATGWSNAGTESAFDASFKNRKDFSGFGRRNQDESRGFRDHSERGSGYRGFGSERGEQDSNRFGGNRRGQGRKFGGWDNNRDIRFGGGEAEKDSGASRDTGRDIRFGGGGVERDSGFGSPRDSGFHRRRYEDMDTGCRERKATSDSRSNISGALSYADPPSEPESAILVHMDEDGTFYLQMLSMEKDILFLSKRVAGSYKGGGGPRLKEIPSKGTVCCAKFPVDGNMYRAVVEDVTGGTACIRYVDYGNSCECSTSDLKFLFSDLCQYPIQAFPCKLRGLSWSLDQAQTFARATLDKDLQVTFTSTTPPFEVDMKTEDGDLLNIMTGKALPPAQKLSPKPTGFGNKGFGAKLSPNVKIGDVFGTKSPKKAGVSASEFEPSVPSAKSPNNKMSGFGGRSPKKAIGLVQSFSSAAPAVPKQLFLAQSAPKGDNIAFISHIGEDGYFYLQLETDIATIESISDQLLALPAGVQHPNLVTGVACAAIFTEDSSWYRAEVYGVNEDNITVVFVDYGNGDTISKSHIKPLSSELLKHAPLAYQCQFPEIGPLSTEAQATIADYLMEHKVTVAFSGTSPPFYVAMLTSDGKDLQEIVCPSNQYRAPTVPKDVIPAGVSHIEDDGRFLIQLYQNYKAIEALQEDLQSVLGKLLLKNVTSLEIGMPCCVKAAGNAWLRGKIVDVAGENVRVLHVDIGEVTTHNASAVFSLPPAFLKQPPFALECRLKSVESWTEDLRRKFIEMTKGKILNATFYTNTAPYRVSLARSIELDLLGLAAPALDSPERKITPSNNTPTTGAQPSEERAYISHVESNGTFYIQKLVNEPALIDLTEKLGALLDSPHAVNDVTVDSVVCGRFTEDDTWYRAKVESCHEDGQYTLRFVDYGNTNVVGHDRMAPLPESLNLSVIPALAMKCVFAGTSTEPPAHQMDKLREYMIDRVVTISFKSVKDDVHVVDVFFDSLPKTLGFNNNKDTEDLNQTSEGAEEMKTTESCNKDEFVDAAGNLKAEISTAKQDSDNTSSETNKATKQPDTSKGKDSVTSSTKQESSIDETEETAEKPETSKVKATGLTKSQSRQKAKVSHFDLEMDEEEDDDDDDDDDDIDDETDEEEIDEDPQLEVKIGERVIIIVSHVDSPDQFFFQLDKHSDIFDDLMNAVSEYFENESEEEDEEKCFQVGDICGALFEDDSWYRVRIESVEEDNTYNVFYVDHGNTEMADISALRRLPSDFQIQAPLAVKAKLGGIKPVEESWSEEALEELKKLVHDKTLIADILAVKKDGSCTLHLLDLGLPIHEELIKKGFAVAGEEVVISKSVQQVFFDGSTSYLESTHLEGDDETAKQIMMPAGAHAEQKIGCVSSSLEELKEVSVFVSHSESPTLFWCQLASSTEVLEEIRDSLETVYKLEKKGNRVTGPVSAGDIVVAVFTEDDQLYRAKVLSSGQVSDGVQQNVAVRFIDYGNESETPDSQIYCIQDKLCLWLAQAICCSLDKIVPVDELWSLEACDTFAKLVTGEELILKLLGREKEGTILVDLVIARTNQSVQSLLVEAGLARAVNLEAYIKTSTKGLNTSKPGDISEMESLEITQPIMESTAVMGDTMQNNTLTYSFEDSDEGLFRFVRLSLHSDYDVVVTSEELPSSFYVQLSELRPQYSSLMAEIAEHIASDSPCEDSDLAPKVGEGCLFLHEGIWYRGEIALQIGPDSWQVKSIDCGWEIDTSQSALRPLAKRLRSLPAQAIHCCLAGIVSVEPEWCVDAIQFFSETMRDARLSMNVMECTDDGRYGVYINDFDNTGSQSVNRAMVDLGYAEVVPGSNIEVQIEMEKSLDTDKLNELEESFNEVSILKYNAHCDTEGKAQPINEDSENMIDKYEESDIYRVSRETVDKQVSPFAQMSESVVSSKAPSRKKGIPPSTAASFNLALAVEKVDQMGCKDIYPEESLSSVAEEDKESDEVGWGKDLGEDGPYSSTQALTVGDGGDNLEKEASRIDKEQNKKDKDGGVASLGQDKGGHEELMPETKAKLLYTWKPVVLSNSLSNVCSAEKMMRPYKGTDSLPEKPVKIDKTIAEKVAVPNFSAVGLVAKVGTESVMVESGAHCHQEEAFEARAKREEKLSPGKSSAEKSEKLTSEAVSVMAETGVPPEKRGTRMITHERESLPSEEEEKVCPLVRNDKTCSGKVTLKGKCNLQQEVHGTDERVLVTKIEDAKVKTFLSAGENFEEVGVSGLVGAECYSLEPIPQVSSYSDCSAPQISSHSDCSAPQISSHSDCSAPQVCNHSDCSAPQVCNHSDCSAPQVCSHSDCSAPQVCSHNDSEHTASHVIGRNTVGNRGTTLSSVQGEEFYKIVEQPAEKIINGSSVSEGSPALIDNLSNQPDVKENCTREIPTATELCTDSLPSFQSNYSAAAGKGSCGKLEKISPQPKDEMIENSSVLAEHSSDVSENLVLPSPEKSAFFNCVESALDISTGVSTNLESVPPRTPEESSDREQTDEASGAGDPGDQQGQMTFGTCGPGGSVIGAVLLDEYENSFKVVFQSTEETATADEVTQCFSGSSSDTESNYDTSSLIFSDTCTDSSVNSTSLNTTASTENPDSNFSCWETSGLSLDITANTRGSSSSTCCSSSSARSTSYATTEGESQTSNTPSGDGWSSSPNTTAPGNLILSDLDSSDLSGFDDNAANTSGSSSSTCCSSSSARSTSYATAEGESQASSTPSGDGWSSSPNTTASGNLIPSDLDSSDVSGFDDSAAALAINASVYEGNDSQVDRNADIRGIIQGSQINTYDDSVDSGPPSFHSDSVETMQEEPLVEDQDAGSRGQQVRETGDASTEGPK